MVEIKKEFNLISKRLAAFVSSREDILSENQFAKLAQIESALHNASYMQTGSHKTWKSTP